jgi:hypothetical protein
MPDEFDRPGGERHFSEREFAMILRRAMEMQQAAPRADAEKALSLTDIQQIAAEVGIDPRHVRAAAMEVSGGIDQRRFHLLGGPSSLEVAGTASREVTPAQWEDLVRVMRSTFGAVGKTGQLGSSLEWTQRNDGALALVSVMPRSGRTELSVSSHHGERMALYYVPAGVASVIVGVAAASLSTMTGAPVAGAAAIGGGAALTVLAATRTLVASFVRRRREGMQHLLDRLRDLIEAG